MKGGIVCDPEIAPEPEDDRLIGHLAGFSSAGLFFYLEYLQTALSYYFRIVRLSSTQRRRRIHVHNRMIRNSAMGRGLLQRDFPEPLSAASVEDGKLDGAAGSQ
jgi:hypothetical protein